MTTNEKESANFYRISTLILDIGTSLLLRILKNAIQPLTLEQFLHQPSVRSNLHNLNERRSKVLTDEQYGIVTSMPVCEDKFDISLIVKLLLNVCQNVVPPGTHWSKNPPDSDLSLVADVNRLRNIRNTNPMPAHASRAKVTEVEFLDTWAMVKQILIRRSVEMGETKGDVEKEINCLLNKKLDPSEVEDRCQELMTIWKKWREDDEKTYADFDEKLSSIESSLQSLHEKVDSWQSVNELYQELNTLLEHQGMQQVALDSGLSSEQVVQELLKHIKTLNETGNQSVDDEVDGARRLEPDNRGMTNKKLDQIAQKIGMEWYQLGIYLGYQSAQLDRLTELYRNQVQQRIFIMLKKWCKAVVKHNEDPEKFLASVFVEMKNLEVALFIYEEATDELNYEPQRSTLASIEQINFDLK